MSWDPSLVDPTDRPSDGFMLRTVATRSGPISLENGARLTFPWARQQKIANTIPGYIYVSDDPDDAERLRIRGPLVNPASRTDISYMELGGSYLPNVNPGLTIKTTGNNGALESGVYLFENTQSWTCAGGTPDVNFQALNGRVRWGALNYHFNDEVPSTAGATQPLTTPGVDLALSGEQLVSIGNVDTFSAGAGRYKLALRGRYIQAYQSPNDASSALYLNPNGGDVHIGGAPVTGQWTTFNPTITQVSTTVSKSMTFGSRWQKIGRMVTWWFNLPITSNGVAGAMVLTMPFAPVANGNAAIGAGYIYNGASNVQGVWGVTNSGTMAFIISTGYYSVALDTNDVITGTVVYEATT